MEIVLELFFQQRIVQSTNVFFAMRGRERENALAR
jgi:hypothetical protein